MYREAFFRKFITLYLFKNKKKVDGMRDLQFLRIGGKGDLHLGRILVLHSRLHNINPPTKSLHLIHCERESGTDVTSTSSLSLPPNFSLGPGI